MSGVLRVSKSKSDTTTNNADCVDWLTKTRACAALRVAPETFQRSIRAVLPADAVRKRGNRLEFRLDALIDAETQRRVRAGGRGGSRATDPACGGPDDKDAALTRLRLAAARRAEADLAARLGQLCEQAAVHALYGTIGKIYRTAVTRIQVTPEGRKVVDYLIDTFAGAEQTLERLAERGAVDVARIDALHRELGEQAIAEADAAAEAWLSRYEQDIEAVADVAPDQ